MKRIITISLFMAAVLSGHNYSIAQTGIITTFAGTGASGYSGDGGPATAAQLYEPQRIARDAAGNVYISDLVTNRVRKVTPSGIITTVAGNGTSGFGGDGGPAISAFLNQPRGLAVDAAGNLYIADYWNNRIRKVDPSGIITTIAGTGTMGNTGDGGPATAAEIGELTGIAVDAAGNIYIPCITPSVIRKVSASGIISTIAGNGTFGFSGDGGPATAAQVYSPEDVSFDNLGNVYISDAQNHRLRKINAAGIISTIAGNGINAYTGDGGPATAASTGAPEGPAIIDSRGNLYFCDATHHVMRKISPDGTISTFAGTGVSGYTGNGGPALAAEMTIPKGLLLDPSNILYVCDEGDNTVRKFSIAPTYAADSFYVDLNKSCSGLGIGLFTKNYAPGMSMTTYFGEGTSSTVSVSPDYVTSGGFVSISHSYVHNGTYTVKHVLTEGGVHVDSLSYTYQYIFCNSIYVNFYLDVNSDCQYEPGTDYHVYLPVTAEIDSNGVAMDTVSSPGGFYYTAYGVPGDVYGIKILSAPAGLQTSCPATGIVYDTLHTTSDTALPTNNIGFNCSSTPGFDLGVHVAIQSGRHSFQGAILADNMYCTPHAGTVTADFGETYLFNSATATPSSGSGHSVSWDLSALTSETPAPYYIFFDAEVAGTWLTPGDTVNSEFSITPLTGDMNPTDNTNIRNDSVKGSFDPNYMQVSPGGCITSAVTQLEYAIGFENTGNDTAYNIFLMDTLSASVDISTFKVVTSSAYMNISKIKYGAQTILKIDFPGINLLDSSHHNLCNGVVIFDIKTLPGLATGTVINNEAGIYFDDNPVVMTNAITNIVNCPSGVLNTSTVKTENVAVYPNPASDQLVIVADNSAYASFFITNQLGQSLAHGQITGTRSTVDIKSLQAGMYFISLSGDAGSKVLKFVKE